MQFEKNHTLSWQRIFIKHSFRSHYDDFFFDDNSMSILFQCKISIFYYIILAFLFILHLLIRFFVDKLSRITNKHLKLVLQNTYVNKFKLFIIKFFYQLTYNCISQFQLKYLRSCIICIRICRTQKFANPEIAYCFFLCLYGT